MVVREDGSKWACQSCLKGHRVSGCTHTDRELVLVPKKGRPVTQCQHCRLERKKRSAHVKCDCGETEKQHHSKEKCIHLREAEERAKAGFLDDQARKLEDDPYHLAAVAEEQGCCCHHGGKCSCSIVKKESQLKDSTPPHGPAVHKPRLESMKSEGSITIFTNGHHKPVHKRNHAAHECGMPYKMPMPRTQADNSVANQAHRSVDSLALDSSKPWKPVTIQPKPVSAERRVSRSEQPSPRLPTEGSSDANCSAIDSSDPGHIQTSHSVDSSASDTVGFPPDPVSSMTDASYDPWSSLPSAEAAMPNNNPFGAWPTPFDCSSVAQPALTAASSGTQSEVDELPNMDDFYGFSMPSIREDTGTFTLDPAAVDANNANRRSLPPGFFGNATFAMPDASTTWQTSAGFDPNIKPTAHDQSMTFPDFWNTPTMPSMSNVASRQDMMNPNSGRPQSQSVGAANAPNDDLIRQLFPDIDVGSGFYLQSASPSAMDMLSTKVSGGLAVGHNSPAVDVSPMDESVGFTTQAWSDGSMSVPADAYTTPYNLDADFSNPDYTGNWFQ